MTIETRNFNLSSSEVEKTSEGLFVRGIVNKPGSWSHPLTGRDGKKFIERVMPNVFTNAIKRSKIIDLLAEHDKGNLLASTQNGSLTLTETADGLLMEARISETDLGKKYHTWIKEGLMPAMSFGMQVLQDQWTNENGIMKRTITDLALFEVSAVRQGAYGEGAIAARSLDVATDIDVPEIEERNFETMNLKELRERKQDLLKQAKQAIDGAKLENRSLEVDEKLQQEILAEEIRTINEQIQSLESNTLKGENNKMKNFNNETEIRAVDQFIRNVDGEELRALTTGTGTIGALTIPTELHDVIIEKLYEVAPLFAMSRNFTPVNGFLEILREQSWGGGGAVGFVAEMVEIPKGDFSMDKVKLEQKRVGSAIELSQHLINDSGIDVVGYATNLLSRRVGIVMDRTILTGDKNAGQFEGLVPSVAIESIQAASATAITIDELNTVYTSLDPHYVAEAVWVVSRKAFQMISKLKDGNGHYFLVRDVAETGVTYKLFGQPVLINDAMAEPQAGARTVLFGNFNAGYATMTKKDLAFKKIDQDASLALKGSVMLMLDGYMDGKILNENAFKFLKQI